ncbi:MAG: metallophosphoesterase [Desulfuromonadales bacterium]
MKDRLLMYSIRMALAVGLFALTACGSGLSNNGAMTQTVQKGIAINGSLEAETAKTAAKSVDAATGSVGSVIAVDAMTGAVISSAPADIIGNQFSGLSFTLPSTQAAIVLVAKLNAGATFRYLAPIDLSNPPSQGGLNIQSSVNIVLGSTSDGIVQSASADLGLASGTLLGDTNIKVPAGKTFADVKNSVLKFGGMFIAYGNSGLSLNGTLQTSTPGSLTKPSAAAWSFGVMADTQWIGADDGKNPNTVAVSIIQQLNQEFIKKGVKFVVQVGDITDSGSVTAIDTTALFRQPLYNAGIGFFPLRGNHEDKGAASIAEYKNVFPQTQNGKMNATPFASISSAKRVNPDAALQPSPTVTGSAFTIGTNFSSPSVNGSTNLKGLSYAFDYAPTSGTGATFVLLDQFTPADGKNVDGTTFSLATAIAAQQSWIDSVLSGRAANTHAFTFSHKGVITENHVDALFGNDPSASPVAQDAFIKSLATNNVAYHMLGHDHIYDRSIITTTDGGSYKFHQILCASDSSKFYIPSTPAVDVLYDLMGLGTTTGKSTKQIARQTQIVQELNTIGYYIFTVDGPTVTVDYYSAPVYPTYSSGEYLISASPTLVFSKRDTFGKSLNGKEFVVAQGMPYNSYVQDSYKNSSTGKTTTAQILGGVNGTALFDGSGRPLNKAVDTGWAPKTSATASDVLTLWGMAIGLGSSTSDTYALSLSFDPTGYTTAQLQSGSFGLATVGSGGNWINAVNQNFGGTRKFVFGPCDPGYPLGTYGVDVTRNTVWAVINYNSSFAAVSGI